MGSNRNLSYFDDWVLLVDVKNKTTYPVPSMFVYFLIQNANNKFTQKVVTCTLHVVSLATGAAAINAGAKGIQLLVALSEITSGLSGLATTALEPELRSLLGNDGYQNLQTVTALVDIAGISIQNMPGIAKKADNLLTRLDNIDFNTNLTPAKLQLKAIKDKLANVFGRGVSGAGSFATHVDMQASLSIIANLKSNNKLLKSIGSANNLELGGIHKYTDDGGVILGSMRNGNETIIDAVVFNTFQSELYKSIRSGLAKLRQTNRLFTGTVIRGRTYFPLARASRSCQQSMSNKIYIICKIVKQKT